MMSNYLERIMLTFVRMYDIIQLSRENEKTVKYKR